MEPLMSKVLDAVTPETVEDWGAAMTDVSVRTNYYELHSQPNQLHKQLMDCEANHYSGTPLNKHP